jgi:Spy/CpxP family protein refolding chaperone
MSVFALAAAALAAEPALPDRDALRDALEARAEQRLDHALDAAAATPEQESRIRALVAEARARREGLREEGRALRTELRGLLLAPVIDRSAVEDVRAEVVDLFDRATQAGFGTLVAIAETFTPDQRATLAARLPAPE